MPKGTCSVEGCERTAAWRGLCNMHYQRQQKTGAVGPVEPFRSVRTGCAVERCRRPWYCRDWCSMHYMRWLHHQAVGPVESFMAPGAKCSVQGCTRRAASRGWCDMHYRRWRQSGDPGGPAPKRQPGVRTPRPKRDRAEYFKRYYSNDENKRKIIRRAQQWSRDHAADLTVREQRRIRTARYRKSLEGRKKRAEHELRRKARKRGNGPIEKINPFVVYERDNGLCHLCGEPVPPEDASLDHVIPISRGGPHTYENVALSHLICNLRRGVKPVVTARGGGHRRGL